MSLPITFHRAAITSDLALLLSSWLAADTTARPDPKTYLMRDPVFIYVILNNWKQIWGSPFTSLVLGATVLLNSIMFTLSAGMDTHIRYAIPSFKQLW